MFGIVKTVESIKPSVPPRPTMPIVRASRKPPDYSPCLNLTLPMSEQTTQLARLLCDPMRTLPQCVQTAEIFAVPGCSTAMNKGDVLMLHFVHECPTVYATNSKGKTLRLPIHAHQEYEILPLDPALDDIQFTGTEALMKADPLPATVRVLEAHCSCHPDENQDVDDIIDIDGVEMDDERGKVLVGMCDTSPIRYSAEMNTSCYTTMISPQFHKMSELINRKFPQRVRIPDLRNGFAKRDLKSEQVLQLLRFSLDKCVVATRKGDREVYSIPVSSPIAINHLEMTFWEAREMMASMYSLVNSTWGLIDPTQETLAPSMCAIPQPMKVILSEWFSSLEGKKAASEVAQSRTQELREDVLEANKEMRRMKTHLDCLQGRLVATVDSTVPQKPETTSKEWDTRERPPPLPPRTSRSEPSFGKPSTSFSAEAITKDVNVILSQREKSLQKENAYLMERESRLAGIYEELHDDGPLLTSPLKVNKTDNYRLLIGTSSLERSSLDSPTSPREARGDGTRLDVTRLTVAEVSDFLRNLGMPQYVDAFCSNDVDGRFLVALDEHCMHDLGMKHLHAVKLRVRIEELLKNN